MISFFCRLFPKMENEETEDLHKGSRLENLSLLGTAAYDFIRARVFFVLPPEMASYSNPGKRRVTPCQATFS
jgi:hypothetical protein